MKKIFILLFVILLIVVSCKSMIDNALDELDNKPIPNLSEVKDGTYYGSEDGPFVSVEVEVKVKNKKITDIKLLKHNNGKGESAEAIIDKMIEENTSEVELVSGATVSSKVIRGAVRNALNNF